MLAKRGARNPLLIGQTQCREYNHDGYELVNLSGQLNAIKKRMLGKNVKSFHYELDEIRCQISCSAVESLSKDGKRAPLEEIDLKQRIIEVLKDY